MAWLRDLHCSGNDPSKIYYNKNNPCPSHWSYNIYHCSKSMLQLLSCYIFGIQPPILRIFCISKSSNLSECTVVYLLHSIFCQPSVVLHLLKQMSAEDYANIHKQNHRYILYKGHTVQYTSKIHPHRCDRSIYTRSPAKRKNSHTMHIIWEVREPYTYL